MSNSKPESPWIQNFRRIVAESTERENQKRAEIGRLPPVFQVVFPGPLRHPEDARYTDEYRNLVRKACKDIGR